MIIHFTKPLRNSIATVIFSVLAIGCAFAQKTLTISSSPNSVGITVRSPYSDPISLRPAAETYFGLGGPANTGPFILSSAISGVATANLRVRHRSFVPLFLTGNNTFAGRLTIDANTVVQVGNGASTSEGTLGSGPISLVASSSYLMIDKGAHAYNFNAGNIISGLGSLTISGSQPVTIPSIANTYSGGTSVNGFLVMQMSAPYTSSPVGSGAITVGNAATLQLQSALVSSAGILPPINLLGGTLSQASIAGSGSTYFDPINVAAPSQITALGNGIAAPARPTGDGLTLSSVVTLNESPLTISANGGNVYFTLASSIRGTGDIFFSGNGTNQNGFNSVIFASGVSNDYSGRTTLRSGANVSISGRGRPFGVVSQPSNVANSVVIEEGAVLNVDNLDATLPPDGIALNGGTLRNVSGNSSIGVPIVLNRSSTIVSEQAILDLQGAVRFGSNTLNLSSTGGIVRLAGPIIGSGPIIISSTIESGGVEFNGATNVTAPITVNSGTFSIGDLSTNTLGTSDVRVNQGAILDVRGAQNTGYRGTITMDGGTIVNSAPAAGSPRLAVLDNPFVFAGGTTTSIYFGARSADIMLADISGAGNIQVRGAPADVVQGTLVFSQLSRFTGNIRIMDGTASQKRHFLMSGTNPVTDVTVDPFGVIEVGLNGTLTFRSLVMVDQSSSLQVRGTATEASLIVVNSVTAPAGFTVDVSNRLRSGTYPILQFSGAAPNISNIVVGRNSTEGNICFSIVGNQLMMNVDQNNPAITNPSATICPGAQLQMTLERGGTPATPIAWTSSNSAVATVDNNGLVTGASAAAFGTSFIRFTNSNGCQATTEVTVFTNVAPVASRSAIVCRGVPIPTILISTVGTGATGIGNNGSPGSSNLPGGITPVWTAPGQIAITGTIPGGTSPQTFTYSIPLVGTCIPLTVDGQLIVTTQTTVSAISGASPVICANTNYIASAPVDLANANGVADVNTIGSTGIPPGMTPIFNAAANRISLVGIATVPGPYNYSIPLLGCGVPTFATGTVIVNASPAAPTQLSPLAPANSFCGNITPPLLSATPALNCTLRWYGTDVAGGTGSPIPSVPSVVVAGISNYYVVSRDLSGCESSPRTAIPIHITSVPAISPLAGDIQICLGAAATSALMTGFGKPSTSDTWTITAGTGAGRISTTAGGTGNGDGMTQPFLQGTVAGTFFVGYTESDGCSSPLRTIQVNPSPTISLSLGGPAITSATLCANASSSTLKLFGSTTGVVSWTPTALGKGNAFVSADATTNQPTINGRLDVDGTQAITLTNDRSCTSTVTIDVKMNFTTAGSINANQTICIGGDPEPFTSVTLPSGGGQPAYRWERSPAGAFVPDIILGATANTYDAPPGLTNVTQFRRVAINDNQCELPTLPITLTMVLAPTPGTIGSEQFLCDGVTPAPFTSIVDATGFTSYRWESANVGTFAPIAGTTGPGFATYSPVASPITHRYRRIAFVAGGPACEIPSNELAINVLRNTTLSLAPDHQGCIDAPITDIIHTTVGATGIGPAANLPNGVTASWQNNAIRIFGTPREAGVFNYSIPLTGGCGVPVAVGVITIQDRPAIMGDTFVCSGFTKNLNVMDTPRPTLPWISDTPAKVTVSPTGAITGVAIGTANIYFVNALGCTSLARQITVRATPTISPALPTVCVGGTITLTGSAQPNAHEPWVVASA